MRQNSTLKGPDISHIHFGTATNIFLLPYILVVRLPKSMTFSFLFIHSFVIAHPSLPDIIKHTTLMHQSVKVSNLMETDVLIDLWPQAILKLHTLRNHSIFHIDVRTKPRNLLLLSCILRKRHAPLLQVQELSFLLVSQILRKVLL